MCQPKIKVVAVIVGYHPNKSVLINLINSISKQVDKVVLIDNGGCENIVTPDDQLVNNIEYIKFKFNRGLGAALNKGFQFALEFGAEFVVMFDQDSDPDPHHVCRLLATHEVLAEKGLECAAVGPTFYDLREDGKKYFPFYQSEKKDINTIDPISIEEKYICVDTLITSGMMVKMKIWNNGYPFNEWLFVDQTDNEWCFRVRKSGYLLYACLNLEMGHALSDAVPIRMMGFSFFRYTAIRRYYYYRATTYMIFSSCVPNQWKRRLAIGLIIRFPVNIIVDRQKLKSCGMMLKGVWDGWRGRNE